MTPVFRNVISKTFKHNSIYSTNTSTMSDYTPILAKKFDVSKIRYSPIKKTTMSKAVYVNYGGDKCVIQFPLMHVPYDLSDSSLLNKDSAPKVSNYTMNVSFKGIDENAAIKNLFEKLQEIEEKVKADVFENRVTWLNDRYDDMPNVVSRLFSSNIQLDKDKETKKVLNRYPATFRVKVPSTSEIDDDGTVHTTFKFDSSDMQNNEIQFGEIIDKIKGSKAQLIVNLMGLWFAGGKYGCTWKVMSGRFQVAQSAKYNYVEDSDDELPEKVAASTVESDEDDGAHDIPHDIEVSKPPAPKPPVTEIPKSSDEEEDDDDEDEEEEAPPPPPPPKKVVKKVVAKK